MPSVLLSEHFAKDLYSRADVQCPIMGVGSVDLERRNRRNMRHGNMSNLLFIKDYWTSRKKESIGLSRRKMFVSEEFTVDSGVDKYTQLTDAEEEEDISIKMNDEKKCKETSKKSMRRVSNATVKTLVSFSDHSSTSLSPRLVDNDGKSLRLILAAARGALPICIVSPATSSFSSRHCPLNKARSSPY